jgi:hypothetical protein
MIGNLSKERYSCMVIKGNNLVASATTKGVDIIELEVIIDNRKPDMVLSIADYIYSLICNKS